MIPMEQGTASNLGKIIKDIVINQKFQKHQEVYIVDKQTGPYKSIQQAIDEATPGSVIKISQGLYNQVLTINKPLTLEPKIYNVSANKQSSGVVLLVSTGIAIKVEIPSQYEDHCKIRGMKISHSANVKIMSYQNDLVDNNEEIFGIFEKNKNTIYSLDSEYVNRVKPENVENIVVWVKSGTLILESSLLSLSFIVKSCNAVVPAVFVNKQAKILMNMCEVRGNVDHETIGVISKEGIVELNGCRFSNHKNGAILLWGTSNNNSKITHTSIQESDIGIHIVGEQNNTIIKRTIISKCRLGIKIGLAVMCQISNSYIFQNETGIQVYSAFPIISKNKIEKNKLNGVGLYSYKKMICQAVIRGNHSIVGNQENGIIIEGLNNYSKIMENSLIGFNAKSGIKVDNEAHPHIILNKIHKNIENGILIIQNSSATIEKNEINANIKMNIGLGGNKSNNTTIMENKIKGSKGEGIFMAECCGASVLRNDVLDNNDGIVAHSSNAIINRNFISKNKGNGILLLKNAKVELCQNFISQNEAVGLYFRDKSYGTIESNIIDGNEIDVNLEKQDKRSGEIATMNTVDGEIRVPKSIGCLLF